MAPEDETLAADTAEIDGFMTVTVMVAAVALTPASFVATAVRVCEPLEIRVVSQDTVAEVTTCVRCQDMLERAQQFEPVMVGGDRDEMDDEELAS